MSRAPVHFILHVPKCAGTTVERHFASALGEGFLIAPRWESVWRNVLGNRYPYTPADPALAGVHVVSGHSLSRSLGRAFAGRRVEASVLLRDPIGYHLSLYNYRWGWHRAGKAPRPPEFARWYGVQRRNPIARFLLSRYFEQGVPALYRLSSAGRLAYLEARLAGFLFVGGHDRAAEMIGGISRRLGVGETVESRNVTAVKVVTAEGLGADWQARILADNALDAVLHARWRDRGWRGEVDQDGGAPLPALPHYDHARLLWADTASAVAKKLVG
ncbi:MAG: hypothetical protein AAGI34_08575 [Pseudomonadota bacterium]